MNQTLSNSYSNAADSGFLSKVIFFFGLAIATSAAGAFVGLNYFAPFFIANPALIYAIFIVELGLVFTAKLWSDKIPLNYFLFLLFAFITGLSIVPLLSYVIVAMGSIDLIIKALLATALTFGAATVFGLTTGYNLSGLRGFLTIGLLGLIVVSVFGLFLPWGNSFEMIFSGAGIIIFTGYTMYDMQKIKNYPSDRYIDAALQIYLDIFNLFVFILRLMFALNRD